MTAEMVIEKLHLSPHPEGGFYIETYRSGKLITLDSGKVRNAGTAIYYLLEGRNKSHFHKINSDEVWIFHQGEPLEIFMINSDGRLETKLLGNRLELNEEPQVVIPADTWFAAQVKNQKGYALVSCIVAPGFDFDDFVLADKNELRKLFPEIRYEIEDLSL